MFRKVQLKFFGIITAILIAIFIAVLSSVNIIMDAMLERQTKVVLQQVASGVEYNNRTHSFTYTDPNRPAEIKEPPPTAIPPTEEPTEPPTEEEQETEAEPTEPETEPETTEPTEAEEEEVGEEEDSGDNNEDEPDNNDPPEEEQPPEPQSPPETDAPPAEGDPNWGGDWGNGGWDPNWGWNPWWGWYPWWGWGDPNWGNDPNQGGDPNWGGDQNWGGGAPSGGMKSAIPSANIRHIVRFGDDKPPVPPKPDRDRKDEPVPKSLGSIDFFVIMADPQGNYLASLNNEELTIDTAQNYIDSIRGKGAVSGMTGNLSYCAEKKNNGTIMVLTDRTSDIELMKKLRRITIMVGIISIVFLSGAAYFVSGLIVRPLKETFEKQKQFISDASHELKTPLTVISTNADVLAGEVGYNKWLNYIQDQADRMNVLVNDLLSLTRLENSSREFITNEFLLSRAVMNAALPFECQAFESRKNFVLNIEEGISVVGSEQHIKQMTAIFIDNALKYSKDGGTVRVSLTKEEGKAVLAVYNTGQGVKDSEKDKLFERFYRSDESRNRSTGGYGLGLAIAKSIIDKHKFKVVVENEEGKSICFKVIM